MKATQPYDTSLVLTSAFILVATALLFLAFPFIQSVLEMINDSVGEFLGGFDAEVSRNLGR